MGSAGLISVLVHQFSTLPKYMFMWKSSEERASHHEYDLFFIIRYMWQGCSKYLNRRIPPQRKTDAEVDGPIQRRHEENNIPSMPRVGIRQKELVQHDEKRQPYPGNAGKVRYMWQRHITFIKLLL